MFDVCRIPALGPPHTGGPPARTAATDGRTQWPEVGSHAIAVVVRGTAERPLVDLGAFWVMR